MALRRPLIINSILAAVAFSGCDESGSSHTVSDEKNQPMSEPYIPPKMPPFPTNYDEVMKTLAPYYHDQRPLDYFFEMYVIDVLDKLPEATSRALDEFSTKHPTFFEKHNGDWRKYVVAESHLSDTIEVAIWDLWIRNSANARQAGWQYHPWHYAQNFADNYFADDTKVDVWEGNALEQAKQRIEAHRNENR